MGFVAYASGKVEVYYEDLAYKIYSADALKVLVENTARFAGGSTLRNRFADLLERKDKPADNRSGDEIVDDVLKKAGIEVK